MERGMTKRNWNLSALASAVLLVGSTPLSTLAASQTGVTSTGSVIVIARDASPQETLAGHEVRRYVYLRCGVLLPLITDAAPPAAIRILIGRKDRALVGPSSEILADARSLGPQ